MILTQKPFPFRVVQTNMAPFLTVKGSKASAKRRAMQRELSNKEHDDGIFHQ